MLKTFSLRICYPEHVVEVKKSFDTKNTNKAWSLARRWMDNCLAICGKDDQGRKYLDAELKIVL